MNTLTTRITPLLLLLFFSCTVAEEEAITPTVVTNDTSVLMEMVNSSWILNDCPTSSTLNIEGFTECDYLNYMSFTEEAVYIRHGNNTYFTKHNICSVDGNQMVVSRQGCGFSEWTGITEWTIVTVEDGSLEIDVRYPNINPNYNERYTYESA